MSAPTQLLFGIPSIAEVIANADWSKGERHLVDVVDAALREGGSINRSFNGLTALEVAVCGGLSNVVELLAERGAPVHKAGRSVAMRHACAHGAVGCMDVLTRFGAVISEQDLAAAVACNRDDVMLSVLKNYAANGTTYRKVRLGGAARGTSLRDWLLKSDFVESARFLFEELGDPILYKSATRASLNEICGPEAKKLLHSLRAVERESIAPSEPRQGVGYGGGARW